MLPSAEFASRGRRFLLTGRCRSGDWTSSRALQRWSPREAETKEWSLFVLASTGKKKIRSEAPCGFLKT